MIQDLKPPLDEALLVHYGVLGMKWGVRKSQDSSSSSSSKSEKQSRFSPEQKRRAKQVAIGVGVLAAVAGAAYLAKSGKLNNISLKSMSSDKISAGKKIVDDIPKTQVDIIHAGRGKHAGFRFIRNGGLPDPLHEYESAFGVDNGKEMFRNLDDGRVAAAFMDPQGRKDFAGRVIPHQVIVPKSMASDINNLDDVREKIWPKLKDAYETVYNQESAVERNARLMNS